jgi:hypothetical protein
MAAEEQMEQVKMTTERKIKPVCSQCGSDDHVRMAHVSYLVWNVERQAWEREDDYADSFIYCDACDEHPDVIRGLYHAATNVNFVDAVTGEPAEEPSMA